MKTSIQEFTALMENESLLPDITSQSVLSLSKDFGDYLLINHPYYFTKNRLIPKTLVLTWYKDFLEVH